MAPSRYRKPGGSGAGFRFCCHAGRPGSRDGGRAGGDARARRGLYRPHGSLAVGAVVYAAGACELTPPERRFRRACREGAGSGLAFGVCCVGSSIGLMAMLVVLGVMSITWMAVIAVLVTAQKLMPPRAALDVPLALAIVAFGVLIIVDPRRFPG